MADKNLKISVKSDLREGMTLTRWVSDLQKTAEKLSRTLGKIQLGGMGTNGQRQQTGTAPGQSVFGKMLADDKRAMEAMGREVDNLERKFRSLSTSVEKVRGGSGLVDRYGRPISTGAGGAGPAAPGGGGGPAGPTGGGPVGGAGGATGGGGFWNQPVGGRFAGMMGIAGWGSALTAFLNTAMNSYTQKMGWATLQGSTQASGGAADMGALGARLIGGDLMPLVGMNRMMGGFGSSAMQSDDLRVILNNARGESVVKGLKAGAKGILGGTPVQDAAKGGLAGTAQASNLYGRVAEQIRTGEGQNLEENALIEYVRQQAPQRVGFARKYGRDFSVGTAAGNRVDPQQVMATVGAVLDVLGTGQNIQKVTQVVTEATRLGISGDAISAMMRQSALGGGNLLERMLNTGMSRPMMGRAGTAAAQLAGNSLMGLNADIFGGGFAAYGGRTNELNIRQLQAGAGALDKMSTGSMDPFQATMNMAVANRPGRSVYTQGVLGKMSIQELMQAAVKGPTAEQQAAGITSKDMARQQLNAVVNSATQRIVNEGGESPAGIRRLMGAGGDVVGAALKAYRSGDQQAMLELNTGFNLVTGEALGTDSLGFLSGALTGGRKGKRAGETQGGFGAGLTGLASQAAIENNPILRQDMLEAIRKLQGAIEVLPGSIREMAYAQANARDYEGAAGVAMKLGGIGKAMQDIDTHGDAAVRVMAAVAALAKQFAETDRGEQRETGGNPSADWQAAGYGRAGMTPPPSPARPAGPHQ